MTSLQLMKKIQRLDRQNVKNNMIVALLESKHQIEVNVSINKNNNNQRYKYVWRVTCS